MQDTPGTTATGLKYCSGCKRILELDYFNRDRRAKDKHMSRCRKCRAQYNREYRVANPLTEEQKTKHRAQTEAWQKNNWEKYLNKKKYTKRRWRQERAIKGLPVT